MSKKIVYFYDCYYKGEFDVSQLIEMTGFSKRMVMSHADSKKPINGHYFEWWQPSVCQRCFLGCPIDVATCPDVI